MDRPKVTIRSRERRVLCERTLLRYAERGLKGGA